MPQAKFYRRYPSGLKPQYAASCLDRSAIRSISRSTPRRWKQLTAASFDLPPDTEIIDSDSTALLVALIENTRLKQLFRAAVCLILIYRQLLSSFLLKAEQLAAVRQPLERLMAYAGEDGFRHYLLRCLPFSMHQWAAWNSRKV